MAYVGPFMFLLPELRSKAAAWRIPVSTAGASQLAWGLLESGAERANRFRAVIPAEPGLAVWLVCRGERQFGPGAAIADLAEWAAAEADTLLVGGEESGDEEPSDAWIDLAVQSLAVAQLSVGDKLGSKSCETSPAFLLGLLHASPAWLEQARSDENDPPDLTCLPGWLAETLGALAKREQVRGDEAGKHRRAVTAACQTLSKRPASSRLRTMVLRRWTKSGEEPSLSAALPRLVGMRSRLHQLEVDFDRTLEQEKLASLQQLAYGASHEINNPLANISTRAQTMLRDETDPERQRKLATISTQAFRAHEMISDMMLFAKPPTMVARPINVTETLAEVIREWTPLAEAQGTALHYQCVDAPSKIMADGEQISVALAALLRNSIEALDLGGQVEVCCRKAVSKDGAAWLELSVADTGPGITPEVRRHLFDPFYSGREAGRGLGLGLSKCWRIVQLHGGSIDVDNSPQGGARFIVRLPTEPTSCPNIRTAG
jgi:signal transduction histidine kinase